MFMGCDQPRRSLGRAAAACDVAFRQSLGDDGLERRFRAIDKLIADQALVASRHPGDWRRH
jgi:hypothetical protein